MTICATWSQPDGGHFHGLCRNEFRRETNAGIVGSSCPVCVIPRRAFPECDDLLPNNWICRKVDGTEWIDTWVPFYKVTITLPVVYRPGPPWYTNTSPNCEDYYLGEFILGTDGGRCGRWNTLLAEDPEMRYAKDLSFNDCRDYTPEPRMELFWSETNPTIGTNPVMTLRAHYRIGTTNYRINCRYTNAPASPLEHDCRRPLSFQTWQNTGGAWNGLTTFRPISESVGASVTLTPLYL